VELTEQQKFERDSQPFDHQVNDEAAESDPFEIVDERLGDTEPTTQLEPLEFDEDVDAWIDATLGLTSKSSDQAAPPADRDPDSLANTPDALAAYDHPKTIRRWRTIAEETGEVTSFPSHRAAKHQLGTEPGTEIHHIVEQAQAKPERSGFDVARINTTDNLTRIPIEVHRQISADYSRKVPNIGIPLRDMLDGEPWDDATRETGRTHRLGEVQLLAPVANPQKVFAMALNFSSHITGPKWKHVIQCHPSKTRRHRARQG
jgi:hypothetical protein